ncbi:hypothetical protein LTR08_007363 [Meristemomyces frigidus]|nr:hypothetical protein LTR08_007363 [Meristemomyces frigidus]
MNTLRSVGYGWGVLVLAGGGSYYFAKRSINADRESRAQDVERRRQEREGARIHRAVESKSSATPTGLSNAKRREVVAGHENPSPSHKEAVGEPAPVTNTQEEMASKGKYEASEPFRSRKGDRFS